MRNLTLFLILIEFKRIELPVVRETQIFENANAMQTVILDRFDAEVLP